MMTCYAAEILVLRFDHAKI